MITLALNPANTELAFLIDQIEHGETVTALKTVNLWRKYCLSPKKCPKKVLSLAQFALVQ